MKYRTDKGAEVGRLIATLGRLGRHMAALPESAEPIEDAAATEVPQDSAMATEQNETTASTLKAAPVTKDAGAANKKKKKGKK